MTVPTTFPYLDFLRDLMKFVADDTRPTSWPPALVEILVTQKRPSPAASLLDKLLRSHQAVLQAALDTARVASELRRYQKFVKPGRPSPHIVQLRQQQAAARQASNQSRQSLIKAAADFVREAGIEPPPRLALDVFINGWMETNLPKNVVDSRAGGPA